MWVWVCKECREFHTIYPVKHDETFEVPEDRDCVAYSYKPSAIEQ